MISSTSLAYFSGLPTCRSLQRNAKVSGNYAAKLPAFRKRHKLNEKLIEIERQAEEIEDYKHGPPE